MSAHLSPCVFEFHTDSHGQPASSISRINLRAQINGGELDQRLAVTALKCAPSLKAFFTPSTETLHHTFNPRMMNNNVFVTRDNEITHQSRVRASFWSKYFNGSLNHRLYVNDGRVSCLCYPVGIMMMMFLGGRSERRLSGRLCPQTMWVQQIDQYRPSNGLLSKTGPETNMTNNVAQPPYY